MMPCESWNARGLVRRTTKLRRGNNSLTSCGNNSRRAHRACLREHVHRAFSVRTTEAQHIYFNRAAGRKNFGTTARGPHTRRGGALRLRPYGYDLRDGVTASNQSSCRGSFLESFVRFCGGRVWRRCWCGIRMRTCLATLLLAVTALDGLAVSPRWAAVRTQRAARRQPAAAAAARMQASTATEPVLFATQGSNRRRLGAGAEAAQACYSRVWAFLGRVGSSTRRRGPV